MPNSSVNWTSRSTASIESSARPPPKRGVSGSDLVGLSRHLHLVDEEMADAAQHRLSRREFFF